MSALTLAAAAALRLLDPTGDAAGDGTLMPPTSPAYANSAVYDIHEVSLVPSDAPGEPSVLAVAMGAIEPSESMPAGFNRVVVDVYLDAFEGGAEATLEGPSLLMPQGRGWDVVVRLTPRGAFGGTAPLEPGQPVEWTPLPLVIDGDVFVVTLPWELPEGTELFAVSGLFDPFSPTDWRRVTPAPSPWSFSSEQQTVPVLDVLAPDHQAQVKALSDGVLPTPAPRRSVDQSLGWLLVALGGVLVALFGLFMRRRVPPPARSAHEDEAGAGAAPGTAASDLGGEPQVDSSEDGAAVVQGTEPGADADQAVEVREPDEGPEARGPEEPDGDEGAASAAPAASERGSQGADGREARPDAASPAAEEPAPGGEVDLPAAPADAVVEAAAVRPAEAPLPVTFVAGWDDEEDEVDDLVRSFLAGGDRGSDDD